ncbi:MAG: anaerobic ribonucleoside-triphosphate reductase activating protein [Kiritimatiellae bacterium]|nr:anaerobic ribonucleoside-triphosphate reductase activating protein [Kiritimatiellia bacterium]
MPSPDPSAAAGARLPDSGQERTIRLAGFDADDIVDGPGLRCVVFVQGCPHHCPGCQNPQTWPFEGGEETTPSELRRRIESTVLDTGVTFSGGEPFAQAAALAELAKMLRPRYDIACYTGYLFEALLTRAENDSGVRELLENIDILVDGPFVEARRDRLLMFRGSANQRILDVPASLAARAAVWTTDPGWVGEDGAARAG